MNSAAFLETSRPFLEWLVSWYGSLETIDLDKLAGDPTKIAIICVDLVEGFCHEGPLASPRVADIVEPVTALLSGAWERGVRKLVLAHDAHAQDSIEFAQFGPHCIRGTQQAEPVEALRALPFFDHMRIFDKNAVNPMVDTDLEEWLDRHPEIATFIVAGAMSDMALFHLAMHLRMRANARQLGGVRVVVPVRGVATFDTPVADGQTPHDGDLLHLIFLYSMMQNGVNVVQQIVI